MTKYIPAFRTILMLIISGIFVCSLTYSYIQIWERENPKYVFHYPTCEGQDIRRRVNNGITWEDILKDTQVVRYIFDYPSIREKNGTITNRIESFYVRPIFKDIPDFIFRAFTYNIIVPEYNNIKFITDNCTISRFELIEIMVQQGRTGGVLIAKTKDGELMCSNCNSINEVEESKRDTKMIPYRVNDYNVLLIIYGSIVVVVMTMVLANILMKFVRREWDRFVRRILSRKKFDDGIEMARIQNYGPFMIIDDYNSNPVQNIKQYSSAAISVLFHYLVYHTVVILPLIFIFLTPKLYTTTAVFCIILFSELIYDVYGLFYYSDCKISCPDLNSLLGQILTYTFLLNFALTIIYILSSTLWALLSIFIDPVRSATIIGIYFAIIYYVVGTYLSFQEYRKKVNYDEDEYEKYGLEFKHLVMALFAGLAIIFMLIAWVVLSFIVINVSDTSSNILMGLVVPLGTFATKLKQNDIITKVLHREFTPLDEKSIATDVGNAIEKNIDNITNDSIKEEIIDKVIEDSKQDENISTDMTVNHPNDENV